MEGRLGRFIDSFRSTPDTVVRKRIIEATTHLEAEGIAMADAVEICSTIVRLHPTTTREWRNVIRLKRVESILPRLVENGVYAREEIADANGQKVVYSRIKPRTSTQ